MVIERKSNDSEHLTQTVRRANGSTFESDFPKKEPETVKVTQYCDDSGFVYALEVPYRVVSVPRKEVLESGLAYGELSFEEWWLKAWGL